LIFQTGSKHLQRKGKKTHRRLIIKLGQRGAILLRDAAGQLFLLCLN
jgi:hypothetical protein